LCRGYWEGDSLKPALNSDGWFHSGDIGKLDHQGYLTILGRKDNMFISGGENIQPEEIEQQLCQREGIKQAVVVPVKNKEFGYRPVAFIAMNQDKSLDEAEIRQYLAEHFPRF
ncbi:MAG: AMP-binding protein, partial [Calditrichae bacterium]|nr:AMP-binding protein [Calditrichia bacterium]